MISGFDVVTVLRVTTMIVFIAVFAGIAFWLLTPAGRRRAEAEAEAILRDDEPQREPRR